MDTPANSSSQAREALESVVIRFAGDSGDGMQLTGTQFTQSTAIAGNDLATFPDFPAEIRAPAGTTYGVSGFQIHFSSHDIMTPGDEPGVLVAMNPAALKVNLADLPTGGLLVVNTGAFTPANLKKAGYEANPLDDGSLDPYRLVALDISKMTLAAVESFELGTKVALRCKNLWTLGLMCWLFDRPREPTVDWLKKKFAKKPEIAEANIAALNAGHAYGETAEMPTGVGIYEVAKADLEKGTYRNITGNEATAWGLVAGAQAAELPLFLGSYPITPASTVLHYLSGLKNFGVTTFQAEDEIAAVCASVGAAFGGQLAITTTSGPGVALKTEAIGLAIMTELPLVIVDIQRAGPSTGMPTKTEQSDLLQAVYGRNGDAPMPVVAASTPGDCFFAALEACRIATKFMIPVMVLTDGSLANGSEPWKIPDVSTLPKFPVKFHTETENFHPYIRDEKTLARVWAVPGTPGLEHRIGGIEKDYDSGNISYDPDNHQKMTDTRAGKLEAIAQDIPEQEVSAGKPGGKLAVVGWGSTYGAINQAVRAAVASGLDVAHIHLRHIAPFPRNLGDLLRGFDQVLVPEMNNGMLVKVLRSEYLVPAEPLTQTTGQPFKVSVLEKAIRERLGAKGGN